MKIKASEATGLQLDWALAKAEGFKPELRHGNIFVPFADHECASHKLYSHAQPSVCMRLMQHIQIAQQASNGAWRVGASHGVVIEGCLSTKHYSFLGGTLAEAVARCVIAMRLGDEFECPDSLLGEEK